MQISRRDAMLGATAAAVVTGAATAPLAIKATGVKAALVGDPVVALATQVKAAYRASIDADDAYEAAADQAGYNICADWEATTVTTTKGEQYHWGREKILEATARGEEWHVRITPKEQDRALAAIDTHQREAERARHDLGLDPVKERKHRARAHWLGPEARMRDTPALTVAGVLAKMQTWYGDDEIEAIRSGGEPEDALETDLSASIYRDLERLAGEARS